MKYNYSDIYLIPKLSSIDSRSMADTSVVLGDRKFDLPIIPSNMKSVIDENLYIDLFNKNIFCIMHRFGIDIIDFCRNIKEKRLILSISLGINGKDKDLLKKLYYKEGILPDYITIDVAHGHHLKVANMLSYIKEILGDDSFVIAGNVCTKEGVEFLKKHGADCVKVGIGPGKSCTTKLKTGFSYPQFSAVENCAEVDIPIIADGGIRHNGDIAKAISVGARMVMCGSLLAGCPESPGEVVYCEGKKKKEFFGSASIYNKDVNKHIEGKKILIDLKPSIDNVLKEIKEDLQSSISYGGGEKLSDLQKVDYVVIK